jgi:hypothetical protein
MLNSSRMVSRALPRELVQREMTLARCVRGPLLVALFVVALAAVSAAQDALPASKGPGETVDQQQDASDQQRDASSPATEQADPEDHRIFGIIPNYRTSPTLKDYRPLAPKRKFTVAAEDSFDRCTFVLAALFAADAQWTHATPSFGHGVPAYTRYYAGAFSDFVIGDLMTEAIFPTVFRQDPRYFRRGIGSGWNRLGYAVGQILWTHTDAGGTQFNTSEIVGNATAVAIGNAYYPDNRTVSSNLSKFSMQIGVDMAANILKEFWPDLDRMISRHHPDAAPH